MSGERVWYIDWLRVLAVLLLFPFHCGRVFNADDPFYAKSAIESLPLAYLIGFIDVWHMPLLFLLAGASTYFALRTRRIGQYVGERSLRLLVPLVFGTLVIVSPQGWFGAMTNDGYTGSLWQYYAGGRSLDATNLFERSDYYGGFTPGHLWFILFLWLLSMVALPLLAWGRTERGTARLTRMARALAHPAWWLVAVFAIMVGEALPAIADKNPFYFLVFFVLGYIVMHDEAFAVSAQRWRLPAVIVGLGITALSVALWRVKITLPDPSWPRALWTYATFGGGWLAIVGFIGYGRHLLDRPSSALSYLAEASYPVYILHQTVIVAIGFYLAAAVPSPLAGWPLLMATAVAVTFALYELVRRVRVLRFCFGMRPRRSR